MLPYLSLLRSLAGLNGAALLAIAGTSSGGMPPPQRQRPPHLRRPRALGSFACAGFFARCVHVRAALSGDGDMTVARLVADVLASSKRSVLSNFCIFGNQPQPLRPTSSPAPSAPRGVAVSSATARSATWTTYACIGGPFSALDPLGLAHDLAVRQRRGRLNTHTLRARAQSSAAPEQGTAAAWRRGLRFGVGSAFHHSRACRSRTRAK